MIVLLQSNNSAEAQAKRHLAPIWPPNILSWETMILEVASIYDIDPDLVAAIVWVESRGNSQSESYAGAVGLMGIMPQEKGFTGRPTAEELRVPRTNLRWGSGILTQILKQAGGDLHSALAAYNGGWELVHVEETRAYSAEVLHHYARAIASKQQNPLVNVTRWTVALDVQSGYGYTTPLLLGEHKPFKLDLVGEQTVLLSYASPRYPLRVVAHAVPIFEAPRSYVKYAHQQIIDTR